MEFNENDLKIFVNNIYSSEFKNNFGGMGAPDLFSFGQIDKSLIFSYVLYFSLIYKFNKINNIITIHKLFINIYI